MVKISELIQHLQQLRVLHGDLPVWAKYDEGYKNGPINHPEVETIPRFKTVGGDIKVVLL